MQELSLNLLDVAENSVRAGAGLIEILVEETPSSDLLALEIKDDGCGMSQEQAQRVTDPFYTTRTTRKVGLGVPFLKMAAQLTGGDLSIESQPGKGTRMRAWFGYSHIDRMPLGDVAGTVTTLIQCNPQVEFRYTYRWENKEFVLDTREVRQTLDGVPIQSPEVITFLGEMIRENMEELRETEREETRQ